MAVGAVALSVPVAFFGSVYMTTLNGLGLWHSIATYSLIGMLILVAYIVCSAIELALKPI